MRCFAPLFFIVVEFFILWYSLFVMETKNFAVCFNPNIDNSVEVKDKLLAILKRRNLNAEALDVDVLKDGFDFVFVVGGDGTILKTARFYARFQTPVFGINLGRLGFLSQSSREDIEQSVDKIIKGQFIIEDRIMLQCGNYTALNDFVLKCSSLGRTSKFILKINGKPVCDYLADGIIISTPTGSTAYGLSAGGPVLTPSLNAFVIVPICPHTLTARPLVIADTEKIIVCVDEDKEHYLYADGQENVLFNREIHIEKSNFKVKLALLENSDFYSVLSDKLHWGVSFKYNY